MKNLKPVNLNQQEIAELCEIMVVGNKKLAECADILGMDHRTFRGKLFTGKLTPEQFTKVEDAVPVIMQVKNKCESRIMEGFAKLVMQHAHNASRNSFDQTNAYYNFEQEGSIAVLDAIYGYNDVSVKLITYVWRAIHFRILHASNEANPFRPLTNAALKLLKVFNEEKLRLTGSGPITDEQVIAGLHLSADERELILDATRKIVDESQMVAKVRIADRDDDYTSYQDKETVEVFLERREVRQAFKDAELEPIELDAVLAKAFPYTGWQENIAATHVNPKTNKRYCRANIHFVLERAEKKVKQALEFPNKVPVENHQIDCIFDELAGKFAV